MPERNNRQTRSIGKQTTHTQQKQEEGVGSKALTFYFFLTEYISTVEY